MNKTTIGKTAALIAIVFTATPASALSLNGVADSILHVGSSSGASSSAQSGSGRAGVSAGVNVDVDLDAEASSSAVGAGAHSETSATVSALTPVIITRADVEKAGSATVSSAADVATEADLSAYAASHIKSDDRIERIESGKDKVVVAYKQHGQLFGILPVSIKATATVAADGSVTLSYPWYRALVATDSGGLETRIATHVKGELGSAASSNAAYTAAAQARVIAAVNAAMKEQVQADAQATVEAKAKAEVK